MPIAFAVSGAFVGAALVMAAVDLVDGRGLQWQPPFVLVIAIGTLVLLGIRS